MGSSGSKQQNRKKVKRRHNLPEHMYDLLSKCLQSLPFPDGSITDQTVQIAASYTEIVDLFDPQEILTKGQRSKGLYIVVKGEAEVLASTGEVIATLTTGSLFGELSTLFYIPCTATVKVSAKASLLLLRAEKLRLALKDQVVSMTLLDYFISKRYFDTNGIIKQPDILSQGITKSLMKEVPMFQSWSDEPLDALIANMKTDGDPILLVPAMSFLVNEGDPADEVLIIGRGRVEVLREKEMVSELDATRWPICIGEEDFVQNNPPANDDISSTAGIFTSNKSIVSVRALSPCMAIIIKNAHITEVAEKYREDSAVDFTDRLERWNIRPGIDEESPIRIQFGAHIILPVLLKRLGDTPLLFEAPVSLVYDLAMDSEIKERANSKVIMGKSVLARRKSSRLVRNESRQYATREKPVSPSKHGVALPSSQEDEENRDPFRIPPKGSMTVEQAQETFEDSDKFILVLKGAMVLGGNDDWTCTEGDMLWVPRKVKHKTKLTAKGDTLTLQLSGATVLEACSKHPNVKLYIPSTLR